MHAWVNCAARRKYQALAEKRRSHHRVLVAFNSLKHQGDASRVAHATCSQQPYALPPRFLFCTTIRTEALTYIVIATYIVTTLRVVETHMHRNSNCQCMLVTFV
jgi:hypothetical protein